MITNSLRAIIAVFMVATGLAILRDKTRKSYDPLAYGLVAFGIDLLYWSIYYGPVDFPGFVRWMRGIYLGFATLLWIAVAIQQWHHTLQFKKYAKQRKMKRAQNRARSLNQPLGTEDPPTNIPDIFDD